MSAHAGQRSDAQGWYQVYAWDTFNDVGSFAYKTNRSLTAPAFTRILYQMVYGQYSVWCEMDDFTGGNAARTGVPLTWFYDLPVTNLRVYFSKNAIGFPGADPATIYNRPSPTGRINFWPSNYSQGADGKFDAIDTGMSASDGHGSFQVFDTSTTPHSCFFAWNSWGSSDAFGMGTSNGANPDWTFVTNGNLFPLKRGYVFVR